MNKYTLAMIGFVFLIAVESQLVKIALDYFSPVALYLFRTGLIAMLSLIILKPELKLIKKSTYGKIFLIEIITTFEYLARFYAIGQIGIVKTSLIFLLAPGLILFFSAKILKEDLTLKKAIADAVIVLCIAAVYLIH